MFNDLINKDNRREDYCNLKKRICIFDKNYLLFKINKNYMQQDIRWRQRLNNFKKAYIQLKEAVNMDNYSDLEREGLIQRFEYTFELSWNTLKDLLENQGYTGIIGSKDTLRLAFERGLITDGETWMEMVESRIKTSHTYQKETAEKIADLVKNKYFILIQALLNRLEKEESIRQG
jgi:nucleotidyltransferase substrate binding protein (TIGR01987 family)